MEGWPPRKIDIMPFHRFCKNYLSTIMADKVVVAFDLYGTLLSTDSIAQELEKHLGPKAQSVATLWRQCQLEYTWRLNSMSAYLCHAQSAIS